MKCECKWKLGATHSAIQNGNSNRMKRGLCVIFTQCFAPQMTSDQPAPWPTKTRMQFYNNEGGKMGHNMPGFIPSASTTSFSTCGKPTTSVYIYQRKLLCVACMR